jgi:DDE superfamily endonuclease
MPSGYFPYTCVRLVRLCDNPQLLFEPPAPPTLPTANDLNCAVQHRLKLDLTERLKLDSIRTDPAVRARRDSPDAYGLTQAGPGETAAFIKKYEDQLNHLSADEAVIFTDAVHPTHAVRPVGCWAPKEVPVAVEQSSGRDLLNIHGAVDLETGRTIMKDVLTVDASSTILLLTAIEAMYPTMRWIHIFPDNARYHHAKLVQEWLTQPGRRIKLRFVPACCPHLNPIERLWGLMHRHTTHNKCYSSFKDFSIAMLKFLRDEVPRNWRTYCDEVTDNFRVIEPKKYRMIV